MLLPSSCFSFQDSRSTGTLARGASDFVKWTAEQSLSRASGRSRVDSVPASLRQKRPVLILSLPPTGPSVPQSPFPKCRMWDWMVLCPPKAPPVQDSIPSLRNLCPWIPALGREYRGQPPPSTLCRRSHRVRPVLGPIQWHPQRLHADSWALGEQDKVAMIQ